MEVDCSRTTHLNIQLQSLSSTSQQILASKLTTLVPHPRPTPFRILHSRGILVILLRRVPFLLQIPTFVSVMTMRNIMNLQEDPMVLRLGILRGLLMVPWRVLQVQ